ncbi:calmodulin-like protein 3 [Physcomitrium patens]|uniref:EF-hand domain-containing protein n=1 Tax=Physcomitrium patens TaxID=3218 RepID=A0A2K1KGW9_PHYPA|nr:calmodulin-like protein 3 [Physcomitrium patens]PNR53015.1 hypothetical protein PHYPA_009390 [Physcomitrium patens]|eukprot:XP_024377416.1 calmodulin-like protein 3 [Physcomitrella patens]
MKGFGSLGKLKKQGSGTVDLSGIGTGNCNGNYGGNGPSVLVDVAVADSPKVEKAKKAPRDESSKKQGLMSKITSRASLKLKKTKSGTGPPALRVSKSEQELARVFKVYDADHDGKISLVELRAVLTTLGGAISEEEGVQLMKDIDTNNDGFISLAEFVAFHVSIKGGIVGGDISSVDDPLRDAFQVFDKDGDKRISADDLQSVLVSLGDKGHSLEDCRQMINNVDKDGDGYVDFEEFQELMVGS